MASLIQLALLARLNVYNIRLNDPSGDGSGRGARAPTGDDYNAILDMVREALILESDGPAGTSLLIGTPSQGSEAAAGAPPSIAPLSEAVERLKGVLEALLEHEAEAFDEDLPVNGADLVQWWAEQRPRLREAFDLVFSS